jgi:hypothetical protein
MLRMRRADRNSVQAAFGEHPGHAVKRFHTVPGGKCFSAAKLRIAGGDELRLGQSREGKRVCLSDFAAADNRTSHAAYYTASPQ